MTKPFKAIKALRLAPNIDCESPASAASRSPCDRLWNGAAYPARRSMPADEDSAERRSPSSR